MMNEVIDPAPKSETKPTGKTRTGKATHASLSLVTGETDSSHIGEPQYDKTQGGEKVKKSIRNCEKFVRAHVTLRKNQLVGVIEIDGKEMSDEDIHRLRSRAEEKLCFTPSADYLLAAMSNVAGENVYDPLVVHINGLPAWDEVKRLDSAFERYLGAEGTPYVRAISRKFFVSLIARALKPGCKVDTVLVLEGKQGAGKSSWAKTLGGEFYKDLPMQPGEKDTLECMRGLWVIELGELDGLSKSDIAKTKRFISVDVDRYRPSYGRCPVNVARRSVFIGTSNDSGYLKDPTGARRFWPLKVGTIDNESFARDRDQILAEAKFFFEAGEPWHLTDAEAIAEQESETDARRCADPWEAYISGWLSDTFGRAAENANELKFGTKGVTDEEIMERVLLLQPGEMTQQAKSRVRQVMSSLGWKWKQNREFIGNGRGRCWARPDEKK